QQGRSEQEGEGTEGRVENRDHSKQQKRIPLQRPRGREHQPEGRQPERAGKLGPTDSPVAPALEEQLARQTLLGVERVEDRVHALALEAPQLRQLHTASHPYRQQFGTGAYL